MLSTGFDLPINSSEMSTEFLFESGNGSSDTDLVPLFECISDEFSPRFPHFPDVGHQGYSPANSVEYSPSSHLGYSPSSILQYSPSSNVGYNASSQDTNFISNFSITGSGLEESDEDDSLTYFDMATAQTDVLHQLREEKISVLDRDEEFLFDAEKDDAISPSDPQEHYCHDNQTGFPRVTSRHSGPIVYSDTTIDQYGQHQYYDQCSNYTTMPLYTQPHKQTLLKQNLPNLPGFDQTNSPHTTSCRFNSVGEDDSGSDSEYDEPPRKGKRGSKSVLLWKFLLEKLEDPDSTPNILCWENKASGVFKFVDTSAVAKLWGLQKRKQDMNFEKLSRGIRHYYKPGMMNRVEGKRLVYKFNWRKVPREYRRRV